MELEDIFLARFAELTPDGLFTVVGGGLIRINAGTVPWSWGLLFLLARLRLTKEETQGQHQVSVERETPNGQTEPLGAESPLAGLSPTWEIGPDDRVGLSFCCCWVNVIFPEAGVYKYRLKIDGQQIGMAKLLVAAPAESGEAR